MGDFILDDYLMADLEANENDVVERENLMMLNRTKKPGVTQSLRKKGAWGREHKQRSCLRDETGAHSITWGEAGDCEDRHRQPVSLEK